MKIDRALRRDRKIDKRRNGHREDGRGVFLIQEQLKKRAEQIRKEREEKERLQDGID